MKSFIKQHWIILLTCFFAGCGTGSFFTHRGMKLEVREAKLLWIKCMSENK